MNSSPPDPPEETDPKSLPTGLAEEKNEAAALEAELLPFVPEDRRDEARAVLHRVAMSYQGPIPMAAEMQRLGQVDSTFPERIMRVYEKQVDHRHKLEEKVVDGNIELKRRGQHYALASVIILGLVALVLAFMGATTAAGIVAGTAIVGVVGIFVTGRVIESKDKSEPEES